MKKLKPRGQRTRSRIELGSQVLNPGPSDSNVHNPPGFSGRAKKMGVNWLATKKGRVPLQRGSQGK